MKRRNFLHTSGILASSLLLQSEIAKAFKLANNKLRIGIIGCGDRGTGLMRTLHSLPDLFQVTAICDVLDFRLEHAKKIADDKAVESYTDYQQLLNALEKSETTLLDKNQKEIKNMIQEELIKRYQYQEGLYQYYLKNNSEIKRAVSVLNNQTEYKTILKM